MLLDHQTAGSPILLGTSKTHVLCRACGNPKHKIRVRSGMPKPIIAPNPYDTPVQIDPAAKDLIAQGKSAVLQAKLRAKRIAFTESVAQWSADKIEAEMAKLDTSVKTYEDKIADCLRQRMILEDQLAQLKAPKQAEPAKPAAELAAKPAPEPTKPTPSVCPF